MFGSKSIVLLSLAACMALMQYAVAQTPTAAQQQAIRSNCVADYRANCSSVPTGGMASLVCLEQHESKLSSSCKAAVIAVDPPTTEKTATTTSATSTKQPDATSPKTATASTEVKTPTTEAASKSMQTTKEAVPAGKAPALSFRGEMRLAAGACARDFREFCPNLPVGHGNVLFCLKVHGPRLDTTCRNALLNAGEVF